MHRSCYLADASFVSAGFLAGKTQRAVLRLLLDYACVHFWDDAGLGRPLCHVWTTFGASGWPLRTRSMVPVPAVSSYGDPAA